ncbi:hypothetical protein KIN20_006633 [Parelaphostrongylus tenuis]|uniref:Uncharacterized protein n=1 Tax=Parelaphostrongylus tenuis TaxID=148309 RepID=A0AAD5QJF9_PARTN|nr:hypothetical protein KIN20_006633 [Parelaphostrongylus tenuis]
MTGTLKLIEDYDPLVEGLKSCFDLALATQYRRTDRISSMTKESPEERSKLKPDLIVTYLARVVSNSTCRRALEEELQ